VLWNADKAYLRELAGAGLPLPRTRWFAPGERPDCEALLREWGAARGVLKPRISATAYGTHLVTPGARWSDEAWGPLETHGSLFQAFVPEIETDGEVSLIFVDGGFSHAVRKRAAPGDFRVQSDFGGSWEQISTPRALRAFGARVLATASRPWVYARVDVVEAARGPLLMELELIEPQLFLTEAAAARLAEALKRRMSRGV